MMIARFLPDFAFALVAALVVGAIGPPIDRWWFSRNARRLSARHARGSDAYFEELRALEVTSARERANSRGFRWYSTRMFVLLCLITIAQIILFKLIQE